MFLVTLIFSFFTLQIVSGVLLEFFIASDTSCWIVGPTSTGSCAVIHSGNPAWATNIPLAKWIWDIDKNTQAGIATITKFFYVAGIPQSGSLNIAADNYFITYLNDVDANCKDSTYGETFKIAEGINCDVNSYIKTGLNKLEIEVNNISTGDGAVMFKLAVLSNF
ncbi:hypothetical protein SteCoe_11272 [Stentor coeruleus]|uniref:Fucolectin tachylectin-4 pentraxin-1 domain-containing protein n=1 Tax=Stentor coeruleus TaxID=5963 RepID=A0A1R2CDF8_9CILI|nr:hypothetical protein SteCoe_11272 [Stentor coeruleus]